MRSTFFGLNIGYKGLQSQQRALDVVSHNIANTNTQGYTRQDVIMESSLPIKIPQGYVGTGVEIGEIRRIRNKFLDMQIRTETKSLGEWEAKADLYAKLEVVFNEPSESGLSSVMDNYWEAWQNLSTKPESSAVRDTLVQRGVDITDTLNHMDRLMHELQVDINKSIKVKVNEINSLGTQIRDLNELIVRAEADGNKANDLRDKRDLLVDNLSKIVDVDVIEDDRGAFTVTVGGGILVSRNYLAKMDFSYDEVDPTKTNLEWVDTINNTSIGQVTVRSGLLKGYIEMRDEVIGGETGLRNKLSQLASRMAYEVNNLHRQGFGIDKDNTTGINFFEKIDKTKPFGAGNIKVNQDIIENTDLLAASQNDPSIKGDGINALRIAQLKNKATVDPMAVPVDTITGLPLTDSTFDLHEGSGSQITGNVDLSGGLDFGALADNTLTLTVNGVQKTITLEGDFTGDSAGMLAEIEDKINAEFFPGAVKVELDGNNLCIKDNRKFNSTSSIEINSGSAVAEALFGANWETTDITTVAGVDANNELTLTIGGETKTITLDVGTYNLSGAPEIMTELEDKINAAFGAGTVSVAVAGGNKIQIQTVGGESIAEISGPAASLLGIENQYNSSFDDFYRSTVARLGVNAQEGTRMRDNQDLLVAQLVNKRELVSGVSLDEEMTNMIRFQHAYTASARVINTMDEMIDLIVNRLGMVGR